QEDRRREEGPHPPQTPPPVTLPANPAPPRPHRPRRLGEHHPPETGWDPPRPSARVRWWREVECSTIIWCMGVFRLNHAVLYVRDVAESVAFYRDVLGFGYTELGDSVPGAAFLRAPGSTNDHDLGLFQIGAEAGPSGAGRSTVGLYHLAWEVDTLGDLED